MNKNISYQKEEIHGLINFFFYLSLSYTYFFSSSDVILCQYSVGCRLNFARVQNKNKRKSDRN